VLTDAQLGHKVEEMIKISGYKGGKGNFLKAYAEERPDYDRGISDGAEYWRRMKKKLKMTFGDDVTGELIKIDLESWFNMRARMIDFVRSVRGQVGRLMLLSNVHVDGAIYIREGEGRYWSELFDDLVLSCEHLLLKPQKEIYQLVLQRAGYQPHECLFVDDVPANAEGADKAGMRQFVFQNEDQFYRTMAEQYELTM
jgi:putative hydrolase of the HAD superfamily